MKTKEGVEELYRRREKAKQMGGERKIARQHERGRLTARERIDRLLDPGTFFELGQLNHSDIPGMEEVTAADGKIVGFGKIDDRTVCVRADDATVLAGAGGRVGGKKEEALSAFAIKKGYPIVNLGEAGGARMPDIMGSAGLSSMTMPRACFERDRAVPMAAAIMGDSFGWPSWVAALADFVVQVKGACMAVSGPRVLEVATSEVITPEELGGWRLHAEVTGQHDRVAEDEEHCFSLIREFISYMPSNAKELPPRRPSDEDPEPRQHRLLDILPERSNRAYDMYDIIKTIVDNEVVFPIKPDFGQSLITCLARIDGHTVGFVANQPLYYAGAIDNDGCDKAISFICLCDSFNIPLIYLQDTPGFLVGSEAEKRKILSKIITFIHATAVASVPKISLVIRKAYGMAYGNMCGTGLGADFMLAWPTADISFMAPDVGVNVVYSNRIAAAPNPEEERARLIKEWEFDSMPWHAAGLHLLDDVIDPRDTRRVIIKALDLARGTGAGGIGKHHLANWPTCF